MGWRSINDPLCGHSCYDDVIVPQKKIQHPHRRYLDPWRSPGMAEAIEEACEAPCLMKKLHKSPLTHTWCFDGPCTLEDDDVVILDLMKTWNP